MRIDADHEYLDSFGGFRVRDADRGAFQDSRMAGDYLFDLVWIDIEAGDNDHVLLAIHDLGKAVPRHHAYITRPEETVACHHQGSFVRPVPVTGHHLRPLAANLAGFADRDFLAIVITDRNVG